MRDSISVYNDLNCKVVGISVDSVFALAKYKEEQKLNFDLVSDFNKEIGELYDLQYPLFSNWMKGITKRSAILIDAEGVMQYVEVLENASEIPDFEKIKVALGNLQASL